MRSMFFRLVAVVVLTCGVGATAWSADELVLEVDPMTKAILKVEGDPAASCGILVVHDWFGVTPFTLSSMKRFSDMGCFVGAIDLYDGQSVETHKEAYALLQGLDADLAAKKIDAAIGELSKEGRKLGLAGFSMGASLALTAAARNSRAIDAAIVWYGDTRLASDQAATMTMPVLAIYGSNDGEAADEAALLSKTLDQAGGKAEVMVYPGAHHAFAQPLFNQGTTYDAEATAASWDLTKSFVSRKLLID